MPRRLAARLFSRRRDMIGRDLEVFLDDVPGVGT
jgi:hypothetical protein